MQIQFVYITAGSPEEARAIGRELVVSRLAACVNIIDPMTSIYMWEGDLHESAETVLIAKTVASKVPALVEKVCALHDYDLPSAVSFSVAGGHYPFMEWIAAQVGPPANDPLDGHGDDS